MVALSYSEFSFGKFNFRKLLFCRTDFQWVGLPPSRCPLAVSFIFYQANQLQIKCTLLFQEFQLNPGINMDQVSVGYCLILCQQTMARDMQYGNCSGLILWRPPELEEQLDPSESVHCKWERETPTRKTWVY